MHQCLKFPFSFCEYIEIWVCSWCHFDASYRVKKTKGGKRGKEGLQLIPSLHTKLYFSSCLNMEILLYTAYFLRTFPKKRQRDIFIGKGSIMVSRPYYALGDTGAACPQERTKTSALEITFHVAVLGLMVWAAKFLHSLLSHRHTHALFYWMTRRDWQHSIHCKPRWHINL